MSDIIHLLPDSVANQIAAGEVIQRPASVIKELVENSLDAGATHIQVVVENAGKTLVQVIDNGKGMSETDARLSFERHATSKIQQATDLFALRTMGFRGEALASIAAVAQVELRTKQKGQDLGTCINIEGSKVSNQEPVACPVGANFAIRNLFFNIPARRKFLKSNQTELSNILAEFERIALAHPDTAFTLHSEGNIMLELPAGNFRQRIIGIFGKRIDSHLIPIEVDTTLARINGFVGMPSSAKKKNAHQYLFVNGRFMRHPYFAKSILTAYERLIPDGQQVPFFINFEVDPSRIDVNIHPTKTEIKFEDDSAIFQILLAAVRESLGKYGAVPAIDFDTEGRPDIPDFNSGAQQAASYVAPPQIHINTAFNPFDSHQDDAATDSDNVGRKPSTTSSAFASSYSPHPSAPIDWQKIYEGAQQAGLNDTPLTNDGIGSEGHFESHYHDLNDSGISSIGPTEGTNSAEDTTSSSLYQELPQGDKEAWSEQLSSDFIQLQGKYIVTPLNSGIALIDQHRAHIRVLYEKYMKQLADHKAPSQRLLFPETINTSPSEKIILKEILPQLKEVGFEITPNSDGEYDVTGTPMGSEGLSPTHLVGSILADAVAGQANATEAIGHIIALSLAKKVALPTGQLLNKEEMQQLVQQLFACSSPNMTPDGNPTLIVIDPARFF